MRTEDKYGVIAFLALCLSTLAIISMHKNQEKEHAARITAQNIKQIKQIREGPEICQLIVWIPEGFLISPTITVDKTSARGEFLVKGPKKEIASLMLNLHETSEYLHRY